MQNYCFRQLAVVEDSLIKASSQTVLIVMDFVKDVTKTTKTLRLKRSRGAGGRSRAGYLVRARRKKAFCNS